MTLRSDNADLRLTRKGRSVGVVSDERWHTFLATERDLEEATAVLKEIEMTPNVCYFLMGSPPKHSHLERIGRLSEYTYQRMV